MRDLHVVASLPGGAFFVPEADGDILASRAALENHPEALHGFCFRDAHLQVPVSAGLRITIGHRVGRVGSPPETGRIFDGPAEPADAGSEV